MLRVLDPVAPIARTIGFFDILVIIQDRGIRTIAYRMDVDLQPRLVCGEHVLLHGRAHFGTC